MENKQSSEDDVDCNVGVSQLSMRSVRHFKTHTFPCCRTVEDSFESELGEEGAQVAELDCRISIDDIF